VLQAYAAVDAVDIIYFLETLFIYVKLRLRAARATVREIVFVYTYRLVN
jgi:hypothetical protein